MRVLPSNVRATPDPLHGYIYIVTLAQGVEERYRLAWQAIARSRGWIPPAGEVIESSPDVPNKGLKPWLE